LDVLEDGIIVTASESNIKVTNCIEHPDNQYQTTIQFQIENFGSTLKIRLSSHEKFMAVNGCHVENRASIGISLGIIGLVFIILGIVFYRNREKMKLWMQGGYYETGEDGSNEK